MTFFEAVAKCYRKYFIFKGRASKPEFWWFYLLAFLFAWPLFLAEIDSGSWASILSFIYFILTISVFFPLAAVWTRRMHDVGKSAWNAFYIFLPVIGWALLLRWATKVGDHGVNNYGEPDDQPFVVSKNSTERN
jgi:uncharacterized membrane protein YhaH (DUF805 family)